MALGDRITIGRFGIAAIAAAVVTALAVASPGPAWGQDTGDQAGGPAASQPETMAPAGMMQMMMGGAGNGSDAAALRGHGFLLDREVFTTIDHPDAVDETAVLGINSRGQIVGGYVDAEGTVRSFLLDDGIFTPIEHPDAGAGPGTIAFGFNDRGQVVGTYIDADGRGHGFLRDKGRGAQGVFTTIDHPDSPLGTATFDINNRGQIVGVYADAEEAGHGFLLDKGVFTTIEPPGTSLTEAVGINGCGQVVGFYLDAEGNHPWFPAGQGPRCST
jgi:uncharacterized membrane protein